MKELPPKGGWKLKRDSATKLIVWFRDGNIRTMYSIDWRHSYSVRDPEIGMARFMQLLGKYDTKARAARIYDIATGKLLVKLPNDSI